MSKKDISNLTIFQIDMIHNVQELSELIQALTKWVMGKPNFKNIDEELEHVKFVIGNLEQYLKEREDE